MNRLDTAGNRHTHTERTAAWHAGPVDDWRDDRIGSARDGTNPTVLARLPESFAAIGDVQWLPGYCVLLTDDAQITRLSDLPRDRRLRYLASVDCLAEAVERACAEADAQFRRVNIEILGNTDPYLHTHIWPRYEWEPAELRGHPVWLYPRSNWADPSTALSARHDQLRSAITTRLARTPNG
jgi:diadenosine tetraphosphate (Ap4A) HIT family hydrolase